MSLATDSAEIHCPYCGERIELIVDLSVEHQEYIEDCSVCCRPISITVTVAAGEAAVTARHENE